MWQSLPHWVVVRITQSNVVLAQIGAQQMTALCGVTESDTAEHAAAQLVAGMFFANINVALHSKLLIPQGLGLDLIRCCTLHILGSG